MSKPKYWMSLEELEGSQEFIKEARKEFPTDIPMDQALANTSEEALSFETNRRDFLKIMGFGVTAATLAACEAPMKKAIPYVEKPDDIIPGVANWYASTSPAGTPILVKTREGRPIKIEGNPDLGPYYGGTTAADQATVLDLYDAERTRSPYEGGNATTWDEADDKIAQKLETIRANGGSVRVLTNTVKSPSTKKLIGEFLAGFDDAKHIAYEPVSTSALIQAHEAAFGRKAMPSYHFDKADVIVSFSCDFLGTWVSPAEFSKQYVVKRNPDNKMSRHFQIEALMSTTGSNADMRFPVAPGNEGLAILNLYNKVAAKVGRPQVPSAPGFNLAGNYLDTIANELAAAAGKGLIVCGTNDLASQILVASMNEMLGNYGTTLNINNASHLRQDDDVALADLARELGAGEVDALLVYGANPVYDSPIGAALVAAMPNLQLSVSFATKIDETAELCQFTLPDSHYLESWGDVQLTDQMISVVQPTIQPIFDTRQVQESFLKWAGQTTAYHDYLKDYWQNDVRGRSVNTQADSRIFWNEALRAGGAQLGEANNQAVAYVLADGDLSTYANRLKGGQAGESMSMVLYPTVGIGDGKQANNPWLQELPDPLTKVTWDAYVTLPYEYANSNGIKTDDVVSVSVGDQSIQMPVVIQPGQAAGSIGLTLGFGRTKAGKVADQANGEGGVAGVNGFSFASLNNGTLSYVVDGVSVSKTGKTYPLARTQVFDLLYDPAKGETYGDDFDRSERIIEETTTASMKNGVYDEFVAERKAHKKHLVTLWDSYFEDPESSRNIHWKMAIDLNKCTGCGNCIVSCQAENNVPVVGKKEVRNRRGMYWMRLDRYYSGNMDNPDVAFQPMLCQHCDNAPCETVCPVLATIHSNEGLNQMTYNRCVGTRYCANNCPYKVRRFNWFNYTNDERFTDINPSQSQLGRLVLNPDVTVRFRGVMEKCSFCVQRLQEGKLRAKVNAGDTFAKPKDGDVQTACQQSCPTGAIVFGDFNDPNSEVSKLFRQDRSYAVIEDIKALPSIQYQALVRNRTEAETKMKEEERQAVQTYNS